MTAAFVLDCSIAMTWCFEDEATDTTTGLLHRLGVEHGLVPAGWRLEIANALLVAERHQRLTAERIESFFRDIDLLLIEVDHEAMANAFEKIIPLARAHRLTVYDALYLELALRRGLPLATLDDDLRRAAGACGVHLLGK